jgi:hypothetical protein
MFCKARCSETEYRDKKIFLCHLDDNDNRRFSKERKRKKGRGNKKRKEKENGREVGGRKLILE